MHTRHDLTDQHFGRLTVLRLASPFRKKSGYPEVAWWCQCDCGHIRRVRGSALRSRNTKSCGCIKNGRPHRCECLLEEYGYKVSDFADEYRAFMSMHDRCYNSKSSEYEWYGGRGIRVDPSWDTFDRFLADVGKKPGSEYSLDRINNNGNYERGNVKWSTYTEQARNTRRNHWITHRGKTQILEDWARELNTKSSVVLQRLSTGWTVEEALDTPIQKDSAILYEGEILTMTEIARRHGIAPRTLHGRLAKGLSLEESLQKPIQGPKAILYQGRTKSIAAWARELGISKITLTARLGRYGFSIERAMTEPIQAQKRSPKQLDLLIPDARL